MKRIPDKRLKVKMCKWVRNHLEALNSDEADLVVVVGVKKNSSDPANSSMLCMHCMKCMHG